MKASYQTPSAALLPTEPADILTVSTQALADISSGIFDTVDASHLF